mmetsp:Transcript_113101/g.292490  ORF Transcript_113101/g.292490 Transcript_113101/m.292490 type:complete len:84 (-) Transcript_113101:7-258(-)
MPWYNIDPIGEMVAEWLLASRGSSMLAHVVCDLALMEIDYAAGLALLARLLTIIPSRHRNYSAQGIAAEKAGAYLELASAFEP